MCAVRPACRGDEVVFEGVAALLIVLLAVVELAGASGSTRLQRGTVSLYIVVIPLLAVFAYLVVTTVLPLLPGP